MCLNIGTPKNINFPFGTNGKLITLGVPILQHFREQWEDVPILQHFREHWEVSLSMAAC